MIKKDQGIERIKDILPKYKLFKWKISDKPYLKLFFNDNGCHYKINYKGREIPNLFFELRDYPNLLEKMRACRDRNDAAMLVIETFWECCHSLTEKNIPAFKVIVKNFKELNKEENEQFTKNAS